VLPTWSFAESLSTDAFVVYLRNLINRRGTPIFRRSDIGSSFTIINEVFQRGVKWIFGWPGQPNALDFWEHMIAIIKKV